MVPVLSIVLPYRGEAEINLALAVLTAIDVYQIREYRLPPLYELARQGRVYYRPERCEAPHVPGACERFVSAVQVLSEGGPADCDDLAPWLAAEKILAGDASAKAFCRRSAAGWHCAVRRGDGMVEDPSIALGMSVEG